MRHLLVLLALAGLSFPAQAAKKPAPPDPVATFDALAERARVEWNVPGLAVVVVKDGKILLAKGYGVRELGKEGAVDADTLFAAASTTKAMTAAAIGMLVDEGKLAWDDPVRKYVPELQLADPVLADSLTLREILTHHTGLPGTDYLWYGGELDWRQILAKLARVGPEGRVRGHFEYQNVMYGLAGDLIGRVSGLPWAEFVRQRIFVPLGMSRTVPLGSDAARAENHVSPHSREDGVLAIWDTLGVVDPVAAAGSVWISANDEARWMRFLLDPASGKDAAGKPLLSPETAAELFQPQVMIQPSAFYPTAEKTKPHWTSYGLGWFQQDYRGRKLDFHTGSIDGLVAIVGLARDHGLGVAVFGNLDHAELRHALMLSAFDLFLDDALERDWNTELKAMYDDARTKRQASRAELEAKRVPNEPPALPLAAYAGTYSDPLFGDIRFTLDSGTLVARIGKNLVGTAEPWHFDTFRIIWQRKLDGISWANFRLDTEGTVSAVEVDGTNYPRSEEPALATTPPER
jgi:CubicO group peptidase (beta-lactamase class C family)